MSEQERERKRERENESATPTSPHEEQPAYLAIGTPLLGACILT